MLHIDIIHNNSSSECLQKFNCDLAERSMPNKFETLDGTQFSLRLLYEIS